MGFTIQLHDVSVTYGTRAVLSGVSLAITPGEVIAITGAAGSGRSTLLKVCAGLLPPEAGRVMIERKNFWELSAREQNDLRRRMSLLFQEPALIANMTIAGNLTLPLRYHGLQAAAAAAEIDRWLKPRGLLPYRDLLPAALSAGLKRHVGFIRALMVDAAFRLWDEPTEGMSPEFVAAIVAAIADGKQHGVASLVTTQDAALQQRIADRSLVVIDGRVEAA